MKKNGLIFMVALLAGMMLAGCSKEDDDKFMIGIEQVSILVGDDYTITPSGAFTARSTDEDVVTVNAAGVIHGVSAGEADVIFTAADDGQTQTCKVSVDWKYKYFEEPILDINATPEQIIEKESHILVSDRFFEANMERVREIRYSCRGTEIETSIFYSFLGGKLFRIHQSIDNKHAPKDVPHKMAQQLTERFGYPSEVVPDTTFKDQVDIDYNYYTFISEKKHFRITSWFVSGVNYYPLE